MFMRKKVSKMDVELQFSGGMELLFDNCKSLKVSLPPECATMRDVIAFTKTHYLKDRPELFVQGDSVLVPVCPYGLLLTAILSAGGGARPGILVLINDADWELEGELEYRVQRGDVIVFISTLHGGLLCIPRLPPSEKTLGKSLPFPPTRAGFGKLLQAVAESDPRQMLGPAMDSTENSFDPNDPAEIPEPGFNRGSSREPSLNPQPSTSRRRSIDAFEAQVSNSNEDTERDSKRRKVTRTLRDDDASSVLTSVGTRSSSSSVERFKEHFQAPPGHAANATYSLRARKKPTATSSSAVKTSLEEYYYGAGRTTRARVRMETAFLQQSQSNIDDFGGSSFHSNGSGSTGVASGIGRRGSRDLSYSAKLTNMADHRPSTRGTKPASGYEEPSSGDDFEENHKRSLRSRHSRSSQPPHAEDPPRCPSNNPKETSESSQSFANRRGSIENGNRPRTTRAHSADLRDGDSINDFRELTPERNGKEAEPMQSVRPRLKLKFSMTPQNKRESDNEIENSGAKPNLEESGDFRMDDDEEEIVSDKNDDDEFELKDEDDDEDDFDDHDAIDSDVDYYSSRRRSEHRYRPERSRSSRSSRYRPERRRDHQRRYNNEEDATQESRSRPKRVLVPDTAREEEIAAKNAKLLEQKQMRARRAARRQGEFFEGDLNTTDNEQDNENSSRGRRNLRARKEGINYSSQLNPGLGWVGQPLEAFLAEKERGASARPGRSFGRSGRSKRDSTNNEVSYRPGRFGRSGFDSDSDEMINSNTHGSAGRSNGKFSRREAIEPLNIMEILRSQELAVFKDLPDEERKKYENSARLFRSGGGKDTDPISTSSVNFESIGGLEDHIRSLKEMVVMPLLYPEIFSGFQITPPRGVLFHGPPGTGKTLMARALASSCSTSTQKVAFFMRKGADVLSKWVGESERQLRLLFEQAKTYQPSIIFFDEIDGLAPVRSSKQDQIHASIVSTLLALMDGLDTREIGQVVVIGATNRIDAIDPALRRPGRFDREFYFPLPSEAARKKIITISTEKWNPPLDPKVLDDLAVYTRGYCGADVRSLCTEAALHAVRRLYPEIYEVGHKLAIDVSSITVTAEDFANSMKHIIPSTERTGTVHASPIPIHLQPLMQLPFGEICETLNIICPIMKQIADANATGL
ncbi:hypothetical protein HDU82_008450, partial [Entophlyctis luteolus]